MQMAERSKNERKTLWEKGEIAHFDITEILLKLVLNTIQSINQSTKYVFKCSLFQCHSNTVRNILLVGCNDV